MQKSSQLGGNCSSYVAYITRIFLFLKNMPNIHLNIDLTIFLLFAIYFTYIYIYIAYEHHSSVTLYNDDNQLCITMIIYIFSISYLAEN